MFITWLAVCVGFRCFKFVVVLTIIALVTVMDLQFLIMRYACD